MVLKISRFYSNLIQFDQTNKIKLKIKFTNKIYVKYIFEYVLIFFFFFENTTYVSSIMFYFNNLNNEYHIIIIYHIIRDIYDIRIIFNLCNNNY